MDTTKKKTILVAEDVGEIRDIIEIILTRMGFEVITVPDGQAGLDAFRKDAPSIIISDTNMPNMNGDVFAEIVKSERPETLFILMSGDAEKLGHKADKFLGKPVNLQKIRDALASLGKSEPPAP